MGDMTVTGAVAKGGLGLIPVGYFGSGKRFVLVTRAGSVSSPKAASSVYMREIKGRWRKIASYCH